MSGDDPPTAGDANGGNANEGNVDGGEGDGSSAREDRSRRLVPPPAGDDESVVDITSHFYRGELDRVTTWRTRMDQTTNWSVVLMAAILTWAFTSRDNPHYVVLVGVLAVSVFLFVEAQRFQEYDAFRQRVRILQRNVFAPGYDGVVDDSTDGSDGDDRWRERLADDLREPTIRLPLVAAIGHRLVHVYFPLLSVLLAAWLLRVTVFEPGTPLAETAAIGSVTGWVVVAVVAGWYLLLAWLSVRSLRREVRREFEFEPGSDE